MPDKERMLSASRIKTLEDCAWKYWCNYHLKVPQRSNDGAARGTVCHTIFELLLAKKHRKHFDLILDKKDTRSSKPVVKLVEILLKKSGFYNEENFEMCLDMIYVGLNCDFFGEGGEPDKPEIKFVIEKENPKYKIIGFIDKTIKYKDKIKIVDYKSSKRKFPKKDLKSNIQAMAYTLASKKIWPEAKSVLVEFQFLKFPRQPLQQVEINEEQLKGFEYYLSHMYEVINSFNEKKAKANYAAHKQETKFFCKAGAHWKCPYLEAFEYYVLLDEEDNILKSAFIEDKDKLKPKEGQRTEKREYEGCPAHPKQEEKQGDWDPFDI